MESNDHKGSELNNVRETWDQNEKLRASGNLSGAGEDALDENAPLTELDQIVKQEASVYDNDNKEDRLLGGERATVNDADNQE